jgi:hypothetical protein
LGCSLAVSGGPLFLKERVMKKVVGLLSVIVLLSITAVSEADFAYPNFASTSGLNMVGSAAQYGDKIRMTPAVAGNRGCVWTQGQQSVGGGFSTSFAFQGTGLGGERDANGNIGVWQIHFILQNTSNTVTQISQYDPATSPRLRISFDGWKDAGYDPSSSFVGVSLNGASLGAYDVESRGIIFRDQAVHNATVTYAQQTLKVLVDNQEVVNMPLDLDGAGLGSAYAGFESYCGARAWANNDLLNWSMQSVPEPATLAILGLGGLLLRRRLA